MGQCQTNLGKNTMSCLTVGSKGHHQKQHLHTIQEGIALPGCVGPPVHVGIGGYADDTTRTSIVTDPMNMSAISKQQDDEFDAALGEAKMKQNAGKKEVMVHFQGEEATEHMQAVHAKQVAYKGTATNQVRYLGGWPARRIEPKRGGYAN